MTGAAGVSLIAGAGEPPLSPVAPLATAAPRAMGVPRAIGVPRGILGLIGAAWLVVIGAQLSGQAGLLHHHELIEGGGPLWLGALTFVPAWQVMVVAMMLPASLPAFRAVTATGNSPRAASPSGLGPMTTFLGVYAIGWTLFGLAAFLGDAVLHRTVDATPWLADRAWLIEVGVLVIAGAWQLAPLKRRGLAACRHPIATVARGRSVAQAGVRHVRDCLASSWALMLLMFAAGFANLAWMAALAALMAYEATGRHGPRVAALAGIVLLGLASAVLWSGVTSSEVIGPLV